MAGQAATLDQLRRADRARAIGPDDVEPLTWALAEEGGRRTAASTSTRSASTRRMTRMIAAWYESGFDLLLTPTMGEPPPPLGAFDDSGTTRCGAIRARAADGAFTALFNVTGQPAISLPLSLERRRAADRRPARRRLRRARTC